MKKQVENIVNKKSNRRDFFKSGWKILGVVAAAEATFFTINILQPSQGKGKKDKGDEIRVIGNVEDFPLNSVTPDRINKVYIIRDGEGGFLALSLTCTHLGCSVQWNETRKEFECPCHASSFDAKGIVLTSPAPRPLDYYPVIIEDGRVKIDLTTKSKRRNFDKNQLTYAL